jgi:F420-dependent methylenetetrahydromethanopterin dehydrogenase
MPKGTPIPTPYFVASSDLEAETGNEAAVEPEVSPAEHTSVEPLSTKVVVLSGVTVVVTGVIGDAPVVELLVDEVLLDDEVLLVVVLATDVEAAVPNGTSVAASLKPWLSAQHVVFASPQHHEPSGQDVNSLVLLACCTYVRISQQ